MNLGSQHRSTVLWQKKAAVHQEGGHMALHTQNKWQEWMEKIQVDVNKQQKSLKRDRLEKGLFQGHVFLQNTIYYPP